MKEVITNINLPKTPATRDCKREHRANNDRFNHGAECVMIVNTMLLSETLCN
jgi:hypothetical protein